MFRFDPKKEFSYVGEFWHPEAPDNQFPGVLKYTPDKGLSLKILVSVDFPALEQQNIKEKTIHGFVEQIKEITLLNCLPSGGSGHYSVITVKGGRNRRVVMV